MQDVYTLNCRLLMTQQVSTYIATHQLFRPVSTEAAVELQLRLFLTSGKVELMPPTLSTSQQRYEDTYEALCKPLELFSML